MMSGVCWESVRGLAVKLAEVRGVRLVRAEKSFWPKISMAEESTPDKSDTYDNQGVRSTSTLTNL